MKNNNSPEGHTLDRRGFCEEKVAEVREAIQKWSDYALDHANDIPKFKLAMVCIKYHRSYLEVIEKLKNFDE